ncbi:TetR/AcrR family transcriptional regulator [Pseudomonas sp. TCU-HL1]|uniref:TetR/AcrR family transcriptional regulator n=1 Tax=Pseudomonas sp. TCU-HL1 TaxID=1856685 RepID=UPI00083DC41F|nr:TetR/AcrR family transcriptional regulator [Pseudomonas sp. TCU-HL1]AOE84550.1 TetR family transcriptional regulator [Pseudomonas sp. TCU-HL1]
MSDKKAQTRERILQAAASAMLRHGPQEPGVADVMSAAGLTVGGFYAHFTSKDALMLEVFEQLLRKRRDLMALVDRSLPGAERRVLAAGFYLSHKHRDATRSGCPLPSSLGAVPQLPPAYREALAEHLEVLSAEMCERPEEAEKALAVIALMVGGLSLARALGVGDLSDRVLRAAKAAVI